MKLLAIETSTLNASLALFDGSELVKSIEVDSKKRSAAALTPALDELFKAVKWKPSEIELIAVSEGPGSFTGLRIGITAAKTLAYVAKAQVLSINSLRVIAQRTPAEFDQVQVVMDAQRRELFVASFERNAAELWKISTDVDIKDAATWVNELESGSVVSGPGLKPWLDKLPEEVTAVSSKLHQPSAIALGELAIADHQAGRKDDLWKLLPKYYRKSAAEEKLEASKK